MSKTFNKLVFIVGCPRSGTTKLAELLAHHPEILCVSETHFFNNNWGLDFLNSENIFHDLDLKKFHEALNDFYEHYRIKDFINLNNLDSKRISEIFKNNLSIEAKQKVGFNPKRSMFSAMTQACKERYPDKLVFCEKTPQHLLNIKEISQVFPHAKFILITRDGRAVVNSLLKMPWRPAGLINNARFWRKYIHLGWQAEEYFVEKGSASNFTEIKFEDLISNPVESLESLCNFIGINYSERMLDIHHSNSDDGQKVFADWEKQWKYKVNLDIDQSRSAAYLQEMPEDEQLILTHFLRDELNKLGYAVDTPNLKLEHRIFILKSYIGLVKARLLRFISADK